MLQETRGTFCGTLSVSLSSAGKISLKKVLPKLVVCPPQNVYIFRNTFIHKLADIV